MINTKRLLKLARKWQNIAALGRKRTMSARTYHGSNSFKHSASVATRGHLFVYSTDGKRFMIPLAYLTNKIFRELFIMSEEEFGLPSDGPITLPCDATSMKHIISLLQCRASVDVDRTMLSSISGDRCSLASLRHDQQQLILYGF